MLRADATAPTRRRRPGKADRVPRQQDTDYRFDVGAARAASAGDHQGGMGLRSMRERAEAAGLALRVESAPGAGTTVTVEAPIPPAERAHD